MIKIIIVGGEAADINNAQKRHLPVAFISSSLGSSIMRCAARRIAAGEMPACGLGDADARARQ